MHFPRPVEHRPRTKDRAKLSMMPKCLEIPAVWALHPVPWQVCSQPCPRWGLLNRWGKKHRQKFYLKSRRLEEPPEPRLIRNSRSCWSIHSWVKSGHRHFAFQGCQHILHCHIPFSSPSGIHLCLVPGSWQHRCLNTEEAFPSAGSERMTNWFLPWLPGQSTP